MKNLIVTSIVFIALTGCNKIEEKKPAAVLDGFKEKYPNAENVDWKKLDGQKWVATFTRGNSGQYYAQFDDSGKWIETELQLTENLIPDDIVSQLDSTKTDQKLMSVSMKFLPNGDEYVMEVKSGKDVLEMYYDLEGNFMRTDTIRK